MSELRFWIAATSTWLFAFGNVERLHAPLNIASFVYVLTAAVAIGMVAVPRIGLFSPVQLGGAVLALFFVLKAVLGYPIAGTNLPITVTEISAIVVTIAFSRQIVKCIVRFEDATAEAAVMQLDDRLSSFELGQEEIYREIRRARLFERPLILATMSPTENSVRHSLHRFLQEVQSKTIEKYVFGRVAELLTRKTSVCDLIARRNNQFILLLPEADRDRAADVLRRLKKSIEDELGLNVQTGMAAFPDEEVTFTGLLERAEGEMQGHELKVLAETQLT